MKVDDNVKALMVLLSKSLYKKKFSIKCVDWQGVYDLSCKLGVCALACDGLLLGEDLDIDEELYYKWIGQSAVKESSFSHHKQVLKEIAERCNQDDVNVFVLKGLSFARNYPDPSHRPCGDIDIFCSKRMALPGYQVGNDILRSMGAKVDTHWYKHSKINYKGILVENHDYLIATRKGRIYKELNIQLSNLLLFDNERRYLYDTHALIPPPYFNALFQTYHSFSHFLAEGIGLKHVLDWATFLQKEQNNIDWGRFYVDCEKYHLKRFVVAMTDIAVHRLEIVVTNPILEVESPYADKLLNSVLYDNSKVSGTSGGAWNHRIRLVKNALKYRWKYTEIAQESFIKHIVASIFGFIFHTED